MAEVERADHHLDEVGLARLQRRQLRPQRGDQPAVDRAAFLQAEQVDAELPVLAVRIGPRRKSALRLCRLAQPFDVPAWLRA